MYYAWYSVITVLIVCILAKAANIRYTAQCVYLRNKTIANVWMFKILVAHDLEVIKQVY